VLERLVESEEVMEEGVMELAEKEAMEEDLGVKGAVLEGMLDPEEGTEEDVAEMEEAAAEVEGAAAVMEGDAAVMEGVVMEVDAAQVDAAEATGGCCGRGQGA